VVAVRLDLPLNTTEIRIQPGSVGGVTLDKATVDQWTQSPSEPASRERIQALAVVAAAGFVAAAFSGFPQDHPTLSHDLDAILSADARMMGVKLTRDPNEPALHAWITDRISDARAILQADDSLAWNRVRSALSKKKRLTRDEVRRLVRESDTAQDGCKG
jgi:hypothetical protein